MAARIWAWLRKPRISWVDVGCVTLIWMASTIVQYFTGWNKSVAVFATAAAFIVAMSMVAFVHGVWESIRGRT